MYWVGRKGTGLCRDRLSKDLSALTVQVGLASMLRLRMDGTKLSDNTSEDKVAWAHTVLALQSFILDCEQRLVCPTADY